VHGLLVCGVGDIDYMRITVRPGASESRVAYCSPNLWASLDLPKSSEQ